MPKIKAILLDMDGVLIDAREWHYEALNRALRLFGREISRHEHLVSYDGLPTSKKLELLSLQDGFPTGLHDFVNRLKQDFTIEMAIRFCRPTFAHQYALARLKQDGYKLAVCSNSIRTTIDTMLSKAGLIEYLEFFLSNQDIKRPKPDPEVYLTAIERLQLNPEDCLIVEDNEHGIRAAKGSGAHIMQVALPSDLTYFRIKQEIKSVEAIC